jgi:nucleoid-associated protein YgaU
VAGAAPAGKQAGPREQNGVMMAETTRKYGTLAGLLLLALLAIGGLVYLAVKPQFQATPQAPPTPSAVTPPVAAVAPPVFDVVRVDGQGNTVLAGRAEPGAKVTITLGNTVVGTATADAQGAFVVLPDKPLPAGAQEMALSETLPSGAVVAGKATVSVDVPAGTGQPLAVASGPNGSSVLTSQGPVPGQLGMGTVDYDANGHAIFSGTAPAGAAITLKLGDHKIGTTRADISGRWKFTAQVPAASGTFTLSATDANGAVLPPVTAPFALATLADALASGHVVIAHGDNLWLIARHVYGQGNMYTLIYSANASKIHDPNLIYPGQDFAMPKAQAK